MNTENSPNPERPLLIIRFRAGQTEPEIWKHTLPELIRNRAVCDEVWFSTGIGYPSLEVHQKNADQMAGYAEELRAVGIIPSIQIQATLGHSDSLCATTDCSAKTWGSYTGSDGTKCQYCSCPHQKGLHEYFRQVARIYAQWHPGSVWFDDDLRISNHSPVIEYGGCCCDDCLKLFAEKEGRSYSREELVEKRRNDSEFNARWLDFSSGGLVRIAETVAKEFTEISPETRFGYQHNSHPERCRIFEALNRVTGSRSASRPGGGAYNDNNPFAIIQKAVELSDMAFHQQGYDTVDQVCAEIESWPRVFTSKTCQGLRVESMVSLALGMDSLSYFIMDQQFEMPELYGKYLLEPLAADAPTYKEFIRYNEGTFPGGAGEKYPDCFPGLTSIGIPCAGGSKFACCQLVNEERVKFLSDKELAELLRGNIILEAGAAELIEKRSLSHLIGGLKTVPCNKLIGHWTEDPLNDGLPVRVYRQYYESSGNVSYIVPGNGAFRAVSEYRTPDGKVQGIANLLLTRQDNTRIAALGHNMNTQNVSTSQVMSFCRIADWVSHGKLPVLADTPVRCMLIPRITPENELRSVTVVNTTIAPHESFLIQLRNCPERVQEAQITIPGRAPVKTPVLRGNGSVKIRIPQLAAWDVCWVRL